MTGIRAITGRYRPYRKSLIPAGWAVWKKDEDGRRGGRASAGPAPGARDARVRFEGS